MNKKFYMEPESEVLLIETSALMAGSPTEDPEIPQGGGEDEETPGF